VAKILLAKKPSMILIRGDALQVEGLAAASRVAATTDTRLYFDTFVGRLQRGAGRAKIQRLPYFAEDIVKKMSRVQHLILVGTKPPVSFFAYPDKPTWLTPDNCEIHTLADPDQDGTQALLDLAEELNASPDSAERYQPSRPALETGDLTQTSIAAAAGAFLPENAVVSDESATSGMMLLKMTAGTPPHDWLFLSGGSIGQGLPVATGAALACPDRKVVCFSGDGGAMQTIQALWTQARENLDVTTVIFSNRKYAILQVEFARVGVFNPGEKAMGVTSLDNPELDFLQLSRGMGVQADRATTAEEFNSLFESAMKHRGPRLIEAIL
jgi:acetolactate synthase-1/2/3 large subunit